MTPIGTAKVTARRIVASDSISVGSRRCAIRWLTGGREKIEVPRSPCAQLAEPGHELDVDRAVEAELGAYAGDVLDGRQLPAITAAGSPGVRCRRPNTNTATTAMTGTVARIRWTM